MTWLRARPAIVLALVLLGLLAITADRSEPAGAASMTFIVNQAENVVMVGDGTCDSTCTLRDAILAANANDGADTITFVGDGGETITYPNPLPAIDGSDGITIDGTGADVQIQGYEQTNPPFLGLEVYTTPGTPLHNVTIRDVTIGYFEEGIRICPGRNGEGCTYDVNNVTLDHITTTNTTRDGIRVLGAAVSHVAVTNAAIGTAPGAASYGVWMSASGPASDLSVTDSTISDVGNTAIGISTNTTQSRIDILRNTVINAGAQGIYTRTVATATDIVVDHNVVTNSVGEGIYVGAEPLSGATISDNHVNGTISGNGVLIPFPSRQVVIEDNEIENVARDGIKIFGSLAANSTGNIIRNNILHANTMAGLVVRGARAVISRNQMDSNGGLGIDLDGDGLTPNDAGDGDSYEANALLNFPVITGNTPQFVNGTACAGCKIELFFADGPGSHGEGVFFYGEATANGIGQFAIPICDSGLVSGHLTTTTATDPAGNTSEFSLNFLLTADSGACATLTPTASPPPSGTATASPTGSTQRTQGDLDCDGEVTPRDALFPMLYKLNLSLLPRTQPCPSLDNVIGDFRFADVNCDGVIDEQDAVAILAHVGEVPIPVDVPCVDFGLPL